MRENKKIEIIEWCKNHKVNMINVRNIRCGGKTRIAVTVLCSECNSRFDVSNDTLFRQKYPGLCTKCAHKHSAEYKKLSVDEIIARFESYGYRVLTPANKINPVGHYGLERTPVEIQNKYEDVYTVSCNNFLNRIDYYIDLNNQNYKEDMVGRESRLECKVRQFLEDSKIPFKQEFRFMDCRGGKYPLPFDFCVYYDDEKKRVLIEVDGDRHFRAEFKEIQKNDRTKNYYCKTHNIPLLRLPYTIFNNTDEYKSVILNFLKKHE